jgi:hypothetical protein
VYHLTSRGDRRESIYADAAGRLSWRDLFAEFLGLQRSSISRIVAKGRKAHQLPRAWRASE